jgi:hypothetical protein
MERLRARRPRRKTLAMPEFTTLRYQRIRIPAPATRRSSMAIIALRRSKRSRRSTRRESGSSIGAPLVPALRRRSSAASSLTLTARKSDRGSCRDGSLYEGDLIFKISDWCWHTNWPPRAKDSAGPAEPSGSADSSRKKPRPGCEMWGRSRWPGSHAALRPWSQLAVHRDGRCRKSRAAGARTTGSTSPRRCVSTASGWRGPAGPGTPEVAMLRALASSTRGVPRSVPRARRGKEKATEARGDQPAATSLQRSKTARGAAFRCIARHKAGVVAVFATADKLSLLIYRMLSCRP